MTKEEIIKELFKEFITPVKSTNVKKIKWDSVSKDLVIQFDDGSIYTYYKVSEAIFNNIQDGQAGTITAGPWGGIGTYPSVGAAVWQYLIDGGYKYKKGGTI